MRTKPVCASDGAGEASEESSQSSLTMIAGLGIDHARRVMRRAAGGYLMLVLSRRAEQQLVFPALGIRVKILQIRGRLVKIGIEAPRDIQVLRTEATNVQAPSDETEEHRLRNELNRLYLMIDALQARIDTGGVIETESAIQSLFDSTNTLEHESGVFGRASLPNATGKPKRLLVVEDNDNERRLMAYLLATHGFDVVVARDGIEAWELLKTGFNRPSVVLLDMEMPLCNGYDTLQLIRENETLCDLPVFAVTGSARSPENEPVGHSWDGWFQKPLDVHALLSRLQELEFGESVASSGFRQT